MAIIAPDPDSGGKNFEPIPQGPNAAICDMVLDLGMQETKFGVKHQVYLRWQVPGFRVQWEKDGEEFNKPGIVGQTFTLSMSQKSNLRPLLESWRGKPFTGDEIRTFDITKLAGAPCLLNITHNITPDKTYANIASIMPVPNGMEKPTIEGEVIVYDADNKQHYDKLPEWLRTKIDNGAAPAAPAATGKQPVPAGELDDDPFDMDAAPF